MFRSNTFRGHGIPSLVGNIVLGYATLNALNMLQTEAGTVIRMILMGAAFVFFPQATYLFFEIKHLILEDGIADDLDLLSILVFGGMSVTGVYFHIKAVATLFVVFPELNVNPILNIIALSFIAAIGGVLGLCDVSALMLLLFPPIVVIGLRKIAINRNLLRIVIGTTALWSIFSSINYIVSMY